MKKINNLLKDAKTIIFFDLEGTQTSQEIIAIGAIKCVLDNKNQIKKIYPGFKKYVKCNGEIGHIIEKLTGITYDLINSQGISFNEMFQLFDEYIGDKVNLKFVSYGNFDMRLLNQTILVNNMVNNPLFNYIQQNYIDFALMFYQYVRNNNGTQLSLVDALRIYKTTPETNIHDPLIDTKNLIHLYKAFLKHKKITIEEYEKTLINHKSYPEPVRKLLIKLRDEKSINYSDFINFIKEDL